MLSRWPIRKKLLLGVAILLAMVALLSFSGMRAVYAYRDLVRSINHRASELPLLVDLTRSVDRMRLTFSQCRNTQGFPLESDRTPFDQQEFLSDFGLYQSRLHEYKAHLNIEGPHTLFSDNAAERQTVAEIEIYVDNVRALSRDYWILDSGHPGMIDSNLDVIQQLTHRLPQFLQNRMDSLHGQVRVQYRLLIVVSSVTSAVAMLMLGGCGYLFYLWIFAPLQKLIAASRRVAAGEFHHRLHLDSGDEMAELAGAMNEMTSRFEQTRDDLNHQVKQRTKEVVRSEQLASVGFLAAGVAHEINNPLASIAWASESLEHRVNRLLESQPALVNDDTASEVEVIRKYLRRIQDEAFRCKGITERLLDFSRLGDVQRRDADLRELVADVIDMLRHLGKYRQKQIHFECRESVVCPVNAPELKQVVLNLITNALDCLEPDGKVDVRLHRGKETAELTVADNGCGMTPEVLEHLFEPFFTRKRHGEGTGLGLSITYRIIHDHGGRIDAESEGPGKGSRLMVSLPLSKQAYEQIRNRQAA